MDQENYNDIDMEIEMDSNDIDVSAEMPNEIVVNNYNSLKNKPSINSVELVGNKTLEDLGITEYVEGEIANFDFIKIVPQLPEKGLINRTYFVPKTDPESNDLYEEYMWINNKWEMMGTKQIQVDLTAYVKNTDYAKPDKGGTIKTGNGVSLKNGVIQTDSIDYNAYKDSSNEYFIGKGTLEKVIEGKELINKEYSDNIVEEQRLENERLRNDIKSIALPGEASGENIHLEDSSNARCEIEISGNHKQETREGYNLFNYLSSLASNVSGLTVSGDEKTGFITVNGTPTNDYVDLTGKIDITDFLEIGETYTLWQENYTTDSSNGVYIQVTETDDGGNATRYFVRKEKVTFVCQENRTYNVNLLTSTIALTGTLTNYKNRYMLYKGTEEHEFEPYGVMPSFEFESTVEAVGQNVNEFDKDTMVELVGKYRVLNLNGNISTNSSFNGLKIPVKSNTQYASSSDIDYTQYSNLCFFDKDMNFLSGDAYNSQNKSFITPSNCEFVTIAINKNYNWFKLEKGTKATSYSPYGQGGADFVVCNKNFLKNNWEDKMLNGISLTKNADGSETAKGTSTSSMSISMKDTFKAGSYIFSAKGMKYSWGVSRVEIKKENGENIGAWYNDYQSLNVTLEETTTIIFTFIVTGTGTTVDYTFYPMVRLATDDEAYLMNQEQAFTVDIQQEMLEGDTFVRQDGKWYEKHCVKTEIMLTFPTTNIEVCGTFANFQTNRNIAFAVVRDDLKITNVRNDILCDKLKAKDNSMWGGKEEGIQTYTNSNKFMISIPFEDIEKNFGEELTINNYSQAFRKYINDNGPFKIYYKLAEPELIECTETQSKVLDEIYNKAHTYKNITNISAESSEVNPIVNVKYLKDTEKYIENKIKTALTEINALNQVRTQMLDAEVEI